MGVNLGHQMEFPWELFNVPHLVIWKDFWSENVIVRRSGYQM